MFRIVLYQPLIPPNTGNVIRLCANTGSQLHIVKPMGFELSEASVRRAGLDYHWMTEVFVHESFANCRSVLKMAHPDARWYAIETGSARRYDQVAYQPFDVLLFGAEVKGLPAEVIEQLDPDALVSIPMYIGNRSLNLGNSVALVTYEAWRQQNFNQIPF